MRRSCGDGDRGYGVQLCDAFEVLDGAGEQDFVSCPFQAAQSEPCERELLRRIGEQGLDLLALTSGSEERRGLHQAAGIVACRLVHAARDLAGRLLWTAPGL